MGPCPAGRHQSARREPFGLRSAFVMPLCGLWPRLRHVLPGSVPVNFVPGAWSHPDTEPQVYTDRTRSGQWHQSFLNFRRQDSRNLALVARCLRVSRPIDVFPMISQQFLAAASASLRKRTSRQRQTAIQFYRVLTRFPRSARICQLLTVPSVRHVPCSVVTYRKLDYSKCL